MTAAIDFSAGLFGSNDYEATRQTIDISGDGSESNACVFSTFSCASLQNARDAFATGGPLGAERTINAISIDDRDFFGDDAADSIQAVPYGLQNVVTANHSFNGIVQDFTTFGAATQTKLVAEITQVSEPGSLVLVAGSLLGLGASLRRRAG